MLLNRGLGRTKVALKHISLSAIVTLSLRPLISSNYSEKLMTMFLIHILSVPALIYHLNVIAPEVRITIDTYIPSFCLHVTPKTA